MNWKGKGRAVALTVDEYIEKRGLDRRAIEEEEARLRAKVEAYELAEIRKKAGLTQTQVADNMGVSQTRVSEIENGQTASVRVGTLQRYAAALGGRLHVEIEVPESDGSVRWLSVPLGSAS